MRKILNEAAENAYMIRNDGKSFRMLQHIYGNKEEIEETLMAAEWLYDATNRPKTKELILELVSSWGHSLNPKNDIIDNILHAIDDRRYKFLSKEFVKRIESQIRDTIPLDDVDALNVRVVDELNQEFLRARFGGMYNTQAGSREMVFRVSSVYFNWFNIIFNFVYEHKHMISSVTVVKDEESTGFDDVYDHNGKEMYRMPIDDFIMLPGNPVVESFNITKDDCLESVKQFQKEIEQGATIAESLGTKMNMSRQNELWERLKYRFFKNSSHM